MQKSVVWATLLLAAGMARAQQEQGTAGGQTGQQQQQQQRAPQATAPTSDAFDRACIDLMHGRTPEGEKAIRALKEACANLMAGRADERIDAEKRRQQQLAAQQQLRQLAEGRAQGPATAEPGQATAPVEPGTG